MTSLSKHILRGGVTTSAFVDQIDKLPQFGKDDLIRRVSGRARTELAELREQAREQGKSEGYMVGFGDGQQAGYRDGYAKGRVEAREEHSAQLAQEFEATRSALERIVREAEISVKQWAETAEAELTDSVTDIAREALAEELSLSRDSILAIVRRALNEVIGGTEVQLHVNPVDMGLVEARLNDLLQATGSIQGLVVRPNRSIEAGCRLETQAGIIDATVEGYLERIDNHLEDAA
ncbi:MAG TPA: hypothetical protein DCY02_01775 [Armatimonadetes bacterium]|nr:hypothetical protein [Armatimonadota bacterium]HCM73178.1 hypothetical protein [Armatimonadota bacterium]